MGAYVDGMGTQCDYLVEFVTVVRTGALSKAAQELSLSQSSLSRHMKALEMGLGTQLLRRRSTGVELTEDGLRVFDRASDIVDIVDDIFSRAPSQQRANQLGVWGLIRFPAYARALIREVEHAPWNSDDVKVRILPKAPLCDRTVLEAFEGNMVDIYFTYRTNRSLRELDGRFEIVDFCPLKLSAIMEASHPLAQKGSLRVEDLDGQLFLHSESDFHSAKKYWAALKATFKEANLKYLTKSFNLMNESDWLFDFGQGIIVLPDAFEITNNLQAFGKACVPIEGLTLGMIAVYRASDDLARRVVAIDLPDA